MPLLEHMLTCNTNANIILFTIAGSPNAVSVPYECRRHASCGLHTCAHELVGSIEVGVRGHASCRDNDNRNPFISSMSWFILFSLSPCHVSRSAFCFSLIVFHMAPS